MSTKGANRKSVYFKSTGLAPTGVWRLTVTRNRNGVVAEAIEGRRSEGIFSIAFGVNGSRRETLPLAAKRITDKVFAAGMAKMEAHLRDHGLIETLARGGIA